jgi:hypothetical protein
MPHENDGWLRGMPIRADDWPKVELIGHVFFEPSELRDLIRRLEDCDDYMVEDKRGHHDADMIWGKDSDAESAIIVTRLGRTILISLESESVTYDSAGYEGVSNYRTATYIIGRDFSLAPIVIENANAKAS